jgi:hypothetical protein
VAIDVKHQTGSIPTPCREQERTLEFFLYGNVRWLIQKTTHEVQLMSSITQQHGVGDHMFQFTPSFFSEAHTKISAKILMKSQQN